MEAPWEFSATAGGSNQRPRSGFEWKRREARMRADPGRPWSRTTNSGRLTADGGRRSVVRGLQSVIYRRQSAASGWASDEATRPIFGPWALGVLPDVVAGGPRR